MREFLRLCRRADENDIVATATALTARSIGIAVRKFVLPLVEPPCALSRIRGLRRRNKESPP